MYSEMDFLKIDQGGNCNSSLLSLNSLVLN